MLNKTDTIGWLAVPEYGVQETSWARVHQRQRPQEHSQP
ncbi:uncharacterized protein METZ01_LOCUS269080, partial [marine metagenome]